MQHVGVPFSIQFDNGSLAQAFCPQDPRELSEAFTRMGLQEPRPVLVLVGGASRMTQDDLARVNLLFSEVLVPLAEAFQAYVVDGGTDTGIMEMMGEARKAAGAGFQLIGVVPRGLATLPSQTPPSEDAASLEPNHTHFLLVPGTSWGDDSPWLSHAADVLARGQASVTVLINGGEVTWQDASESVKDGRPILVMAGSGRTADILAAGLQGSIVTDERAEQLLASGLLQAVDLQQLDQLALAIEAIFAGQAEC